MARQLAVVLSIQMPDDYDENSFKDLTDEQRSNLVQSLIFTVDQVRMHSSLIYSTDKAMVDKLKDTRPGITPEEILTEVDRQAIEMMHGAWVRSQILHYIERHRKATFDA